MTKSDDLAAALQEIARLRGALKLISEIEPVEGKASKNRGAMVHMQSIAKAALTPADCQKS